MNNQNTKNVNPFILFVFFIAAVILALPLRVYQLIKVVEPDTGFWADKSNISIPIFYAIIAVGTICPLVLSFVYRKGLGRIVDTDEKKTVGGILALVAAAGFVTDATAKYRLFTEIFNNYSMTYQSSGMVSYLSKSGAIATGLEAFFAVLAGVYFIMLGIALLTGKNPSEYKLLAIMPVFWAVFRIMYRFMRKIAFLNVSELFLELLMIVFLLMFFMAFAQVTAKVNGKGLEWKLFAYGLPASLFCLLCFVPRVVVYALGLKSHIAADSSIEIVDLTCAVFVIYALVDRSRVFRKTRRAKDELAE